MTSDHDVKPAGCGRQITENPQRVTTSLLGVGIRDGDPRGRDLDRPGRGYETARHRDFLHPVYGIGDNAAADRVTKVWPLIFLPVASTS
jgi:hypothetical protein